MSAGLRVAFDARSLSSPVTRGWDRYTVGLVRALVRRGVSVTLLCRRRQPVHETHAAALGCPVIPLSDRGGLWWEQVSLPRALRRFDLYHAPAEHGVPLFAPCPTVLTIHSVTAHSYAELIGRGLLKGRLADYLGYQLDPHARTPANLYWNAQVKRAGAVIVPSEFARREVVVVAGRLGVPAERIHAIPLACDDAFLAPRTDEATRAALLARLGVRSPYLLYVGGYEAHKNVPGLVAAFAELRRRRPDYQLVMVGSQPAHGSALNEAARHGLAEPGALHFLHGLGPELPALYDGAELFVSMSWRESFGLPALEAMTRGVAVVSSAWGAAPEVVGDGGRLVDPRDPQAAAEAITALLDDPGRGTRARSAASRFSWDATAEATLEIYRKLVAGG